MQVGLYRTTTGSLSHILLPIIPTLFLARLDDNVEFIYLRELIGSALPYSDSDNFERLTCFTDVKTSVWALTKTSLQSYIYS